MSGGVDSSVVAALMKEGRTMLKTLLKLYDDTKQSKEEDNVVLDKIF